MSMPFGWRTKSDIMLSMRWRALCDALRTNLCIHRGINTKLTGCDLPQPFMGMDAFGVRFNCIRPR